MITITMKNEGGTLDSRQARSASEAAVMAAEMIRECGELYPGDSFLVSGHEEDAE